MDDYQTEECRKWLLIQQEGRQIICNNFGSKVSKEFLSKENVKTFIFGCFKKGKDDSGPDNLSIRLHENEFKKLYNLKKEKKSHDTKKTNINDWEPCNTINLNNLDFTTYSCLWKSDQNIFTPQQIETFKTVTDIRNKVAHDVFYKTCKEDLLKAAGKNKEIQEKIEETANVKVILDTKFQEYSEYEKEQKKIQETINCALLDEDVKTPTSSSHTPQNVTKGNLNFWDQIFKFVSTTKEEQLFFETTHFILKHCNKCEKQNTSAKNLKGFIKEHINCDDPMEKFLLFNIMCFFLSKYDFSELLKDYKSHLNFVTTMLNAQNENCLMNAIKRNDRDVTEILLQTFNWNLLQIDSNGDTALSLGLKDWNIISLFVTEKLDTELVSHNKKSRLIALTLAFKQPIPTLIKSLEDSNWNEEKWTLRGAFNFKIQIYLHCDTNNLTLAASLMVYNPKRTDYIGKQPIDTVIQKKVIISCEKYFKDKSGLYIHEGFKPILFFLCTPDPGYEYILKNISKNKEELEITGAPGIKEENAGICFSTKTEVLKLECFYVMKRPKRKLYVIPPDQDHPIFLEKGWKVTFPKKCFKHQETVQIWEKEPNDAQEGTTLVKYCTPMVFIQTYGFLKLNQKVEFTYSNCPSGLKKHLVKYTENGKKQKMHVESLPSKTGEIRFSAKDFCGKCVVFCEDDYTKDPILKNEIKLLYLNYKKCTAWVGIEESNNDSTLAWIVVIFKGARIEDFTEKNNIHFRDKQHRSDLIIRDFCTFHIKCLGEYADDTECTLHVQFLNEENFVKIPITKNKDIKKVFEIYSLPDVEKFSIELYIGVERELDKQSLAPELELEKQTSAPELEPEKQTSASELNLEKQTSALEINQNEEVNMAENIGLLCFNYKKCTAWIGIQRKEKDSILAWIVILFQDKSINDFSQRKNINFITKKKKSDLFIRDFCTFYIKCSRAFADDTEHTLHVQFLNIDNFLTFPLKTNPNYEDGSFSINGLPDVSEFKIVFNESQYLKLKHPDADDDNSLPTTRIEQEREQRNRNQKEQALELEWNQKEQALEPEWLTVHLPPSAISIERSNIEEF